MSIDQTKLLSLINEVLSQQAKIRKGTEAVYSCPFCHHYKPKLEVNISTQKWHCWVCNIAGMSFRSFFKKLKVARTYYTRLYDITKDKRLNVEQTDDIKKEDRKLPSTFIPLSDGFCGRLNASPHRNHAMSYLSKRKITEEDIMRYNIGYAEDGEYSGRVVIPSYDGNGELNFFSSRTFYDNSPLKYKNPNWSKDVIGFELFVNWDEPITLVEGVFDALAVRRNAIPLFGKTLNFALKEAIVRYGVSRVNVVLDNDAKIDALDIQEFLTSQEVDVHLIRLDDKDPSVLGFNRISKIIQESVPTDFHSLIAMKLFE
jgi:DNA primase